MWRIEFYSRTEVNTKEVEMSLFFITGDCCSFSLLPKCHKNDNINDGSSSGHCKASSLAVLRILDCNI